MAENNPGMENQRIVDEAKKNFEAHQWEKAIDLFRKSIAICNRQSWQEGVQYAQFMIKESWGGLNTQYVEEAKAIATQNPNKAIDLYDKSVKICSEQNWPEGIKYAKEQIALLRTGGEKKKVEAEPKKSTPAPAAPVSSSTTPQLPAKKSTSSAGTKKSSQKK